MGKIVIILGPSGSGKSRSIKNMDPNSTVVVNVLKKDLPFRGSRTLYSPEKQNMVNFDKWDKIVPFIAHVSDEMPSIKTVIIDDARYVMEKEMFARAKEVGYSKFTDLAVHFQKIIEAGEIARDSLYVVFMMHDEDVMNDKNIVGKKCKTAGKMISDHYDPVEVVPICIYCAPTFDKDEKPVYQFYVHKCMVDNGVEIPAKTPEGMFDTDTIPNDLNMVIQKAEEYYNSVE